MLLDGHGLGAESFGMSLDFGGSGPVGIERYSRRALAGEFANAMREALALARR